MGQPISAGEFQFGGGLKPLLIAGPCVIESESSALGLADTLASMPETDKFRLVFKASYLKDNRSSGDSFRGPGLDEGLEILRKIKEKTGLPVLSDVHCVQEVAAAAEVLDIVQVPAFLCRQTSLLEEVAVKARTINVKKGQFMAPEDMKNAVGKIRRVGGGTPMLTERGTTYGYHNLIVDFRSFAKMKELICPVIYDVTHSLQRPAGLGAVSGGEPALVGMMMRAAAAVPCDGFFIEIHPEPTKALSDGASMLPLDQLGRVLDQTSRVFELAREFDE